MKGCIICLYLLLKYNLRIMKCRVIAYSISRDRMKTSGHVYYGSVHLFWYIYSNHFNVTHKPSFPQHNQHTKHIKNLKFTIQYMGNITDKAEHTDVESCTDEFFYDTVENEMLGARRSSKPSLARAVSIKRQNSESRVLKRSVSSRRKSSFKSSTRRSSKRSSFKSRQGASFRLSEMEVQVDGKRAK